MAKFKLKLAEVPVSVSCNYKETQEFCKDYLIQTEDCAFDVQVTLADIRTERKKAEDEYGEHAEMFTNAYLETLAVYRKIAEKMPFYGVVLFHGSVIAVDDKAYLFTAPSGTGKSTHARLWRECLGDRAYMVNDDKPLLRVCADGRVIAYGTPWDGKHRLSRNVGVTLQGISILSQAKENAIYSIEKKDAFPVIFQQTYRPTLNTESMKKTLFILDKIMEVGLWKLECNISKEAALLSYKTMSGEVEK